VSATDDPREGLEALRAAVDSERLRQVASALPTEQAAVLRAVADAMDAPDDAEAASQIAAIVARARASGVVGPEVAGEVTGWLAAQAEALDGAGLDLGRIRVALDEWTASSAAMAEGARAATAPDSPERALLEEGLAIVSDPRLLGPLSELLESAGAATEGLQALLRDPPRDAAGLSRVGAQWAARLEALELQAGRLDVSALVAAALPLVAKAAELARATDHPGLADVLLLEAGLLELRAAADPSSTPDSAEVFWLRALEAAEANVTVEAARVAARRLQAGALDAGDYGRVAELAARVAAVAYEAEAPKVYGLACLEQALALVQLGRFDDALVVVDDVAGVAANVLPELLPRTVLTRGQVLLQADREDEALEWFDKAITLAGAEEGYPRELGYALVGWAQCLGFDSGDERGLAALELARDTGVELGDARLYVQAVINRVAYHDAGDDHDAAVAEMVAGRSRVAAMGAPDAVRTFDVVAEELEARWGKAEFEGAIERFMGRARDSRGDR
jgi:tetratricopeptide (TPR) repeat protein